MTSAMVLVAAAYVTVVVAVVQSLRMTSDARLRRQQDRIERKLDLIISHLDISVPDLDMVPVEEELRQGRTIQAIKLYREITGVGLKEAKDAIDNWGSRR